MSQENVEVVRRTLEAINERRFDSAAGEWDPQGEWRPAMAGAVEGTVYRGEAALRRYFDDVSENFSELRMIDLEFRDLGDRVLVLRRGKLVFGQSYLSRDEALEAVGLSE